MTVRRQIALVAALVAVLFTAACGGGDSTPLTVETEEPLYLQGLQLKRQGRNPEALVCFLKVVEKRGEQASAESHFEAGLICLQYMKDYVEAIHHFQKYLELQSNSRQAPHVRELVNTAKREFARSLPARPPEEQSLRPEAAEELEQLRRTNAELRAEIATLRGGGAAVVGTRSPGVPAPREPARAGGPQNSPMTIALPDRIGTQSPASAAASPAVPSAASRNASAKSPVSAYSGRTHVVTSKDTLWAIARSYYGSATNAAKVQAIFEANRDVMRNPTDLHVGTTLKIP